jgi:hypothetical protein
MSTDLRSLRPRHREILRLKHLGVANNVIAAQIGISVAAVAVVLRSPLAKAELARLQEKADELTVNAPLRVALANEINGAGIEALRLRRRLMNDRSIDTKLRARIGEHFVDRVIFDRNNDEKEGEYRDILRRLDEINKNLTITPPTVNVGVMVGMPTETNRIDVDIPGGDALGGEA